MVSLSIWLVPPLIRLPIFRFSLNQHWEPIATVPYFCPFLVSFNESPHDQLGSLSVVNDHNGPSEKFG